MKEFNGPKYQRGIIAATAAYQGGSELSVTVDMANQNVEHTADLGTVYAQARLGSDGEVYINALGGDNFLENPQAWLDSGDAEDVWVERTIDSGSLDLDGIGTGRVQLNANRDIGVQDTTEDTTAVTAQVTLSFYNASSGGTLLDTAVVDLSANRGPGV